MCELIFFGLLIALLFLRVQRYVHWRGPQCGTHDGVEDEHLRLYYRPEEREEDQE